MQRTWASRKQHAGASLTSWQAASHAGHPIEVVIPFTSLRQVQSGLQQAERLCAGLSAAIRVVRVVIVPFPLGLEYPAVPVSSIVDEMRILSCNLPLTFDVRLSREHRPALVAAMLGNPLVLLSAKRRFWRTREEKVADDLRRAGYEVLVSYEGEKHA